MGQNDLNLMFERWKASLREKNRSSEFVSSNFEELFEALSRAKASFNEAHAFLQPAIKAHQPGVGLAKAIWKQVKNNPKNAGLSEKSFLDGWNKDIADKATNAFYGFFELKDDDDDGEPKVYGNMSAKEYRAQRKLADSFPILDTEELEKKLHESSYNPIEDLIANVCKDEDGNSN